MITSRPVLTALVAGAVLATGGTAALISSGGAQASPASARPAEAPHGPQAVLPAGPGMAAAGLLHGEYVVSNTGTTGTTTVLVQNGSITGRSGTSVTVKSKDGFTMTWTVTSSTTIHGTARPDHPVAAKPAKPSPGSKPSPRAKHRESVTDLAVGDTVQVVGTKTGTGATARSVSVRPPKPVAPTAGTRPAPKPPQPPKPTLQRDARRY